MYDVLGYTADDAKTFHSNIVKAVINREPIKTVQTQYGLKHTYYVVLDGKNGNRVNANVVVIIQKDWKRVTLSLIHI